MCFVGLACCSACKARMLACCDMQLGSTPWQLQQTWHVQTFDTFRGTVMAIMKQFCKSLDVTTYCSLATVLLHCHGCCNSAGCHQR